MQTQFDIVLVTEDRYADPPQITEYIGNILRDDALLTEAMQKRNLRVTRKSWSDPAFDWASARYALFRTTWDYFDRFDEFRQWLSDTEIKTTFINDIQLVRWNMDKHYLHDLEQRGIHTVETLFAEQATTISLAEWLRSSGWENAILKPAVSGTARHTYRINPQNADEHNAQFRQLVAKESMMLQPFQQYILEHGEVAMMVIGGKFTHAVLKKAKAGDFRVQDDFGGTLHIYQPSEVEIAFAEAAVNACNPKPLYARVDIIRDNYGAIAIMELEIIEPELWFRRNPDAAERLADEIRKLF